MSKVCMNDRVCQSHVDRIHTAIIGRQNAVICLAGCRVGDNNLLNCITGAPEIMGEAGRSSENCLGISFTHRCLDGQAAAISRDICISEVCIIVTSPYFKGDRYSLAKIRR